MNNTILSKFQQQASKARGTKVDRLLMNPSKYLFSAFFYKLVYPIQKKGLPRVITTFFDEPMKIVLPSGTDLFLLGLKTHDSELRLTQFLIQRLLPGQTVLDIGAHYGFFSLLCSKLVADNGQVFAFDASQSSFQILDHNVAEKSNISTFHCAVGDVDGKQIAFYEFPVFYSEFNSRFVDQYEQEDWFKNMQPQLTQVKSITVDRFCQEHKISPDVIKVDVEGAELEVLQGMRRTMEQSSPAIVLEFPTASIKNKKHWMAHELLLTFGYKPYKISAAGEAIDLTDLSTYLHQLQLESDNIVYQKH